MIKVDEDFTQNINDIPIKSECSKEKSYLFYNFAKRCFDLIFSLMNKKNQRCRN